jgi:flagellar motor switch protein FliN/FliY
VLPVENAILEQAGDDSALGDESAAEESAAASEAGPVAAAPAPPPVAAAPAPIDPVLEKRKQRINKVPVSLIVRIATRKMEVQQLREIAPGALLMFDQPCDSLLDVFVDNRLYCRGEAVKIGEQFGIKINECNAQVVREKKVHQV